MRNDDWDLVLITQCVDAQHIVTSLQVEVAGEPLVCWYGCSRQDLTTCQAALRDEVVGQPGLRGEQIRCWMFDNKSASALLDAEQSFLLCPPVDSAADETRVSLGKDEVWRASRRPILDSSARFGVTASSSWSGRRPSSTTITNFTRTPFSAPVQEASTYEGTDPLSRAT